MLQQMVVPWDKPLDKPLVGSSEWTPAGRDDGRREKEVELDIQSVGVVAQLNAANAITC